MLILYSNDDIFHLTREIRLKQISYCISMMTSVKKINGSNLNKFVMHLIIS